MTSAPAILTLKRMEVCLTAEQEATLSRIAAQEDKGADELAREIFSLGLAAEARFAAAVKKGQDAARRGDFVEQSEVWAAVEQILQS